VPELEGSASMNTDIDSEDVFDLDTGDFIHLMDAAARRIASFVESARERRILTRHSGQEIRAQLGTYTFEEPIAPDQALDDCINMLERWNLDTTHPRHFGWFNPSPHLASVVAEAVTAAYNPQLAVWQTSPVGAEIEMHLLRYLGCRLGYRQHEVSGSFTSGGAEANLTAIVLALTKTIPGYSERGLAACGAWPTCYVSAEFHRTVEKAAAVAGLGREAVRIVPVGADGAMNAAALDDLVESDQSAGRSPVLVVANVGSTNMGALDPLRVIADICRKRGLWFHADAAWGGAAALSDKQRYLLTGIEQADSITVDPHKWLSMPLGMGAILTRHPVIMQDAFRVSAAYAVPGTDRDFYTSSIQWSRRFCGLALFLALAVDGRARTASRLDHQAVLAELLRTQLREKGWVLDNESRFPVVCFHDVDCPDSSQQIAAHVNDRGQVWVSGTTLPTGEPSLRACITSFRTQPEDIATLVSELELARDAVGAHPVRP
jgi:glutamate/tyrosine decarboxylase-like PLP-dependent enzyme